MKFLWHPREVVKLALGKNATAVIVAHNHPSGVAELSLSDIAITHNLRSALGLIDIPLLDHFIIGVGEVTSLVEPRKNVILDRIFDKSQNYYDYAVFV